MAIKIPPVVGRIQEAIDTPFDNTSNGFASDNVQEAIEEGLSSSVKVSRGPTIAAFDGTGTTGRWLEFYANNPSNNNPFIIAEPAELIAVSISASSSCTGSVGIYKNNTLIHTITLTSAKKERNKNLSVLFTDLDEISVKVTSGSIPRPTVFMFIRTLP